MTQTTTESQAHLARQLSLPSVVAFGLSYMAPALVMVIFGSGRPQKAEIEPHHPMANVAR